MGCNCGGGGSRAKSKLKKIKSNSNRRPSAPKLIQQKSIIRTLRRAR